MMPLNRSKHKPKPSTTSFSFDAIGTSWHIEIYDDVNTAKLEEIKQKVLARVEEFDKNYSRFRSDSLITKMSKSAGKYALPADATPMFNLYSELYEISDGMLTPLIGNTLSDAGYDAEYSLRPKDLSRPPDWDDVINYKPGEITLALPVLLDFGALGKGYLVDIVGKLLENSGMNEYCVDASGDLLQKRSGDKLRVGLENPDNIHQIVGVAQIKNQALCGSAVNRRKWKGYHHIINPHTLASPRHLKAVWVVADNAMLADVLATALFFVHAQELLRHYTFEYALVYENNSLEHSPKFPAEFFE